MENLRIRRLETTDAKAIVDIYASIVRKTMSVDIEALVENHAQSDSNVCYVAELDSRVIGFIISYILTLGFGIEKSAWIPTLCVYPEFMGKGVGNQLARKIFEIYKSLGIGRIYTSARWDSTDMLSFFKTMGFERSEFINLQKHL
ncbi:MAG: GNAT family N-acetyltransferase [Desulfatitalea sp.]|nr:GNAT family N-acetyltransferase [Desulfatitalea sp.]NNJ99816.1 GNAT family N-acetyltransferase [Desulfatitalea sp.]